MPPNCNEGQLLYITYSYDMSIDAVKLNLLLCLFFLQMLPAASGA